MSDGNQLYAKINEGVRVAKVIKGCDLDKYAFSANCCRKVNFPTNLDKVMLPLLMEPISWPPADPINPIIFLIRRNEKQ